MALQLGALRDALRAAQGVSEELAAKAAEEVAGYDNRLAGIERQLVELRAYMDQRFAAVDRRIDELRAHMDQRFTEVTGRMNTLTWMIGATWAMLLVVIGKLFVH